MDINARVRELIKEPRDSVGDPSLVLDDELVQCLREALDQLQQRGPNPRRQAVSKNRSTNKRST